jgi:hypothetical protein
MQSFQREKATCDKIADCSRCIVDCGSDATGSGSRGVAPCPEGRPRTGKRAIAKQQRAPGPCYSPAGLVAIQRWHIGTRNPIAYRHTRNRSRADRCLAFRQNTSRLGSSRMACPTWLYGGRSFLYAQQLRYRCRISERVFQSSPAKLPRLPDQAGRASLSSPVGDQCALHIEAGVRPCG